MDNKAKSGAPQISIREFTDLRDIKAFVGDRRYNGLPLRAIMDVVRKNGLRNIGVDIADYGGEPAGCVAFQWDYRGNNRSCYLFALHVKPEYRRRGVADRLISLFLSTYRRVFLGVEAGNEAAVNLYKKKGFVFTGENEPVEGRDIKEMVKEKKFSVRFDCGARSFYWTGQIKSY